MTKKKKLKLSLIGCIIMTVLAPTVGIIVSIDRLLEYHDGRNESGTGPQGDYIAENEIDDGQEVSLPSERHYLGDIQDINRPGLMGAGIGFISLLGVILFTFLLIKDRRETKNAPVLFTDTGDAID